MIAHAYDIRDANKRHCLIHKTHHSHINAIHPTLGEPHIDSLTLEQHTLFARYEGAFIAWQVNLGTGDASKFAAEGEDIFRRLLASHSTLEPLADTEARIIQ